ncbi:MAG TPA: ClcB-like voltage-gated chloride channel protein [Steroidobacteraceae bacterium]|nr:ClcB-like voltage-gated chloride channel protein [Steroidobacteraceae bacterium]
MTDESRTERGSRANAIAATVASRLRLSLLTRLRLLLFGHEELAGIVFWAALVGFCGALSSVVFREGMRLLEFVFTGQTLSLVSAAARLPWWLRLTVPVVGGLLAGVVLYWSGLTRVWSRAVDYMEAVRVGEGRIGFRLTLLNCLSSLFSIASGGSIGREGPMVQLAAMLGSRIGILTRVPAPRLRLMVACGAAAGIAAAYNAPISGALFVSEIVVGSTAMESFGPLVVASVTSNVTIHRFLGYGPVYQVPHVEFASNLELGFFVLLGVLLGHLAPPFLAFLDFARSRFTRLRLNLPLQLGLGGLLVGAVSLLAPQVWGNGYSVVTDILNAKLIGIALLTVLIAKVFATGATVGSGAVGGIFTPTLFIGCAIGALVGEPLHAVMPSIASSPAAYALIGMGGFLAATTHAPLTSILMVFEMTGDYEIVLPLMLACVTAHYTAKVYRRGESVYHASLARAAGAEDGGGEWRLQSIDALIKWPRLVVQRNTTLRSLFARLPRRPVERVYVVDGTELIAWLDPHVVAARLQRHELEASLTVEAVASPITVTLAPGTALGTALDGFLRAQSAVLPVTQGEWRNTLIGEVSRHDVLLAIQDRLTFPR